MTEDQIIEQISENRNSPHLEGIIGMLLKDYREALLQQKTVSGSLPLFGDLIYEQDLPDDITDAEYSQWYRRSYVVDGVRMGYPLQPMITK